MTLDHEHSHHFCKEYSLPTNTNKHGDRNKFLFHFENFIQSDYFARGPKRYTPRDLSCQRRHFEKSIPEFRETHSSVLGCERRPVSASIMSRSCFVSFLVCVYKFLSYYLNNLIFIDNSLRSLARDSHCMTIVWCL